MTLFQKIGSVYTPWVGDPVDGVRHPMNIETAWSTEELAAINLYTPAPAAPVPDGKVSTSVIVVDVGGVPSYVHQLRDLTADELKAHAARKRWMVEQGGIVVSGIAVATDDRSMALINGTVGYLDDGGAGPIKFKATSGWVDVDTDTIRAIKQAIGAHIQACFAAEATVDAAIDAGTITTTAEIDAWAWPSTE